MRAVETRWRVGLYYLLLLLAAPLYAQSSGDTSESALVIAQTVVFEQQVQRFDAVGSARALRRLCLRCLSRATVLIFIRR